MFFVNLSSNIFTVKITNKICPRNSILNFFYHKSFYRVITNIIFCKNIFGFRYSYMVTNLKFRVFIISSLSYICLNLNLFVALHCIVLICCIYLLCQLSGWYAHCLIQKPCIYKFSFECSNKSFSNNKFPVIVWGIHFYITVLQPLFLWSTVKITSFIHPYFVWFVIRII